MYGVPIYYLSVRSGYLCQVRRPLNFQLELLTRMPTMKLVPPTSLHPNYSCGHTSRA